MHKFMSGKPEKPEKSAPNVLPPQLVMAMVLGGIVMLAAVLGLVLLGLQIDRALGTRPWVTLGLVVLSAPVTVWALYRFMIRAVKPKS
jgi:F0F1-type ATP synthase assembly protein I